MPVTVKLSKLFYDRLGEEIADELVNWFTRAEGEEGDSVETELPCRQSSGSDLSR